MSKYVLTANRPEFSRALVTVAKAISKRNTLPILSHVLLDVVPSGDSASLTLTTTDLDTAIRVRLECAVSFSEPRSLAIPEAALFGFVSKLSTDSFTFEWSDDDPKINLKGGKSKYTLTSAPAEDFPQLPDVLRDSDSLVATVAESVLKRAFMRTLFAASKEEHKSILMGALLEAKDGKLHIVTTDTHRLADCYCRDAVIGNATAVIVPARPLQALISELRDCDDVVSIYAPRQGSNVTFVANNWEMTSRLLDGQFPNYEKVIPKTFERSATFNPTEMGEALRRIDIVSSTTSQKGIFGFGRKQENLIEIRAESSESGSALEDEVSMTFLGEKLSLALNVKYFIEALDNMCQARGKGAEESVTLRFNGHLQPLQLGPSGERNADDEWLMILMPMQA